MPDREYDVAVLGAGPAGLQAAIHAARRRRKVLVLGRAAQAACARGEIENYFGTGPVRGSELVRVGREQAARSGAELREEDAVRVAKDGDGFGVALESGDEVRAGALVLAMGVRRARLGAPGEKELAGKGVSYCVDCDGMFFRGKRVVVTGDGSAAAEGALTLLKIAREVHLVSDGLDVSGRMKAEVDASAVVMHVPEKIARILGEDAVRAVELAPPRGVASGARLEVDGVFIEFGGKGVMDLALGLGIELDPESMKHVVVDRKQRTNVAGVFAAGDVTGPPWQVAKAVGEGCVAGLEAAAYAGKAGPSGAEA